MQAQEQFNISEGIDGSACNYTILYSESASQVLERILCGSVTISASKCTTGQCIHTFDIPSTCSNITRIAVTVFGTSILGNSPMSVLEISKHIPKVLLDAINIILLITDKTVTHDHNQITPDSLPITLYSIVGGSSFAGILFLLMVIITLAFFLKKLYKSVQR